MRRSRQAAPAHDPTGWLARALRDRGMPQSEVRAVLEANDHVVVRRYFELHRERLTERLADQLRELATLERTLARWTSVERRLTTSPQGGRGAPRRTRGHTR
jgi:DNA-binding transcriptional MerR regulator